MTLKAWLHVLAALLGLALAALIVFLVFGQASEQGQIAGSAPGAGSTQTLCGSVNAAKGRDEDTIATARENLPPVLNEEQVEVSLQGEQRDWVARLHASGGLCVDEVVIAPRELTVRASYPETVSETQLDSFAMDMLSRAFEPPLARTTARLSLSTNGAERSVSVRAEAWRAFEARRSSLGLDRSVQDLLEFRRRTGYDKQFIAASGWS